MVEVFKTNITCEAIADTLATELKQLFPSAIVTFDLEDCDRILRIENETIHPAVVIAQIEQRGYNCGILD